MAQLLKFEFFFSKYYSIYNFLEFKIPLVNLEKSLLEYQSNPTEQPFDLSKVSLIIQQKEAPRAQKAVMEPVSVSIKPKEEESQDVYAAIFASMPQFSGLGPLLRSSKSVELTESETEYVVSCIKHVFEKHIVFQVSFKKTSIKIKSIFF